MARSDYLEHQNSELWKKIEILEQELSIAEKIITDIQSDKQKMQKELSLKDIWVKHHQLSVQEHLSREHVLKEDIKELEQELHQQRFNNEHNLSIDQKVSDEMDRLRKELREAREVIGFYGNTENWAANKDEPFWSIYKDEEEIDKELFGGKRARKFLNKYKTCN